MISIVLRVNHFEVVEAANAAAGLKAFAEVAYSTSRSSISSLGTANGFDVIAAMRERAPALAVVAVSGMTALDFVSQALDLPMCNVCRSRSVRTN